MSWPFKIITWIVNDKDDEITPDGAVIADVTVEDLRRLRALIDNAHDVLPHVDVDNYPTGPIPSEDG